MALSKDDKKHMFNIAIDLTKAFGQGGTGQFSPSSILIAFYEALKEIREDIEKN